MTYLDLTSCSGFTLAQREGKKMPPVGPPARPLGSPVARCNSAAVKQHSGTCNHVLGERKARIKRELKTGMDVNWAKWEWKGRMRLKQLLRETGYEDMNRTELDTVNWEDFANTAIKLRVLLNTERFLTYRLTYNCFIFIFYFHTLLQRVCP